MADPRIKNEDKYEALRDKGYSKEKSARIANCVLILDTLKFLISVAWEGKLLSNGQCEELALKLDEAGKMFGGWRKSLENPAKKNRDL